VENSQRSPRNPGGEGVARCPLSKNPIPLSAFGLIPNEKFLGTPLTRSRSSGPTRVSIALTFRIHYVGLPRTDSEIDGDFSQTLQKFSYTLRTGILRPRYRPRFPTLYRHTESKTRMMGLPEGQKSFKIALAVIGGHRKTADRTGST